MPLLWVGIVSIVMIFASLTSAVIVTDDETATNAVPRHVRLVQMREVAKQTASVSTGGVVCND